MKRSLVWSVVALLAFSSSAVAQSDAVVIAVLPFEDRGSYGQDKEVFRALEVGIPAALAVELSRHPRVRVADRNRVAQALKAQQLGPDARLDAATAARVGSEARARYAVTGNFADFYGKFRVDARIVDVGSGRILKVVSNNEPALQDRAQLSRIIQTLAEKALATAGLPSASGGSPGRTVTTEALTQYSLGLLYESEGDKVKAGEHYKRALTAFPDYPDAREGLQRLR
jgi:TolB-like protein